MWRPLAWWIYLMTRQCMNKGNWAIQSLSSEMGPPPSLMRSCQKAQWSPPPKTTGQVRLQLLTAIYVMTFWYTMPYDLVHRNQSTKTTWHHNPKTISSDRWLCMKLCMNNESQNRMKLAQWLRNDLTKQLHRLTADTGQLLKWTWNSYLHNL